MAVQSQHFQTTEFVRWESEQIESTMSAFNNICMQEDLELMYSSEFEDHFLSEEHWHPSSLSSSKSLDSSSLKFPAMKSEDIEITRAISAIFSSDSSSAIASTSDLSQVQNNGSLITRQSGFKRYDSTIPPTFEPKRTSCGQKMIKDSISYLKEINSMKDKEEEANGHQLLHIRSERKRREKLNGSFYELRLLLPPSSKKDKASVLCKTKDYLKTLEAQIFKLEQKNQMLEKMNILPTDNKPKQDIQGSIYRDIQIIDSFEPVIGIRRINLKITVSHECDLLELVLHALEYLKEIRVISLVAIDANTDLQHMVLFSWVTLKFDIKASDWDEISFKKGMQRAVDITIMSS